MKARADESLPLSDYLASTAVSFHDLLELDRSPAHFQFAKSQPILPPSGALLFGQLYHALVLEGAEGFARSFAVAPRCDRRTREGRALYEDFKAECGDRAVVDGDDYFAALQMLEALQSSATFCALSAAAKTEISIFWTDRETGIDCRARLDAWVPRTGIVWDLKTTQDPRVAPFEREIFARQYFRQLAFYADALEAVGRKFSHAVIIAQEKAQPFGVCFYRLLDDVLAEGRDQNRRALAILKQCRDTETFPGYPPGIVDLGLPKWAWKQIEAGQS